MAERSEDSPQTSNFDDQNKRYFDADLRFAQPFLAQLKWTIITPLSPQVLSQKLKKPVKAMKDDRNRQLCFCIKK